MPIYEYICTQCNTEFELMRPFSEVDKPAVCPKCNSEAQKLVSGFASKVGFYIRAPAKLSGKSKKADEDLSKLGWLIRNGDSHPVKWPDRPLWQYSHLADRIY